MIKIRAIFEKRGRAKYISHLDLNRCMQRCFKKSGIPIWYTEGFNPHIYINFLLPLSLGYESGVELMDFNITEDIPFKEMLERLNRSMPEGIKVTGLYNPTAKHTGIKFADFKVIFKGDVSDDFRKFMDQESIVTIKKTKRGEAEIDLKPEVKLISVDSVDGNTAVTLRLPAGTDKNINPSLLTDLFLPVCDTEIISVERTAVLNGEGKTFI